MIVVRWHSLLHLKWTITDTCFVLCIFLNIELDFKALLAVRMD
jgi:hypothetical protein